MVLRISCNDIFLSISLLLFIVYDLTYLFTLQNECINLMLKWLLICHFVVLLMKIALTTIDNLDEETNCSTNTNKVIAFIFYIILYPFLIIWNVIGTIWFIQIEETLGIDCRLSVDDQAWAILLWLTINYFLSIVYAITSIAILIEWCKKDEFGLNYETNFNEDLMIMDLERGFYTSDHQRSLAQYKLNKNDMNKLRKYFVISRKEILKLGLIGQNCSICFESMENLKKPIVKLPKCLHLFHFNCIREWVKRSPSCPNCRLFIKASMNETSGDKIK